MKKTIKIGCVLLFLVLLAGVLHAQDSIPRPPKKPKVPLKDRIFFGGDLGLQFGDITFINLSPAVGYKITERLGAGVGVTYQYFKDNYYDFSADVYGGRVFAEYILYEGFYAHLEYEVLNANWDYYRNTRFNISSILAGGGYRGSLGGNFGANILVLWNLTESPYSPYANPIIRAGFMYGF